MTREVGQAKGEERKGIEFIDYRFVPMRGYTTMPEYLLKGLELGKIDYYLLIGRPTLVSMYIVLYGFVVRSPPPLLMSIRGAAYTIYQHSTEDILYIMQTHKNRHQEQVSKGTRRSLPGRNV